ncbi:LacI family DNA-binding transcriptional regulator [Pedobacter sp. JY14-1]|uniref:LacI family DNA-binding transcriptional regulator n=1 Tax=Pedobacter sp. JY14-1 TaxID=3034151 RepID=UPI0023E104EF|nr:LacI family DNA-binding transcriptional regulator [Pedobacter sp. JY14-1]
MANKLPTLKEIAKNLGLSVSTVSRALHDHPTIGLTTRQKVKKMAEDLNYEPNQSAIFFQMGKTFTIGVILPELSEAFFSAVTTAIEETAYKKNYTVLLAQSHDDEKKERELVEKMKNNRIDGLLVSLAKSTSSFDHFERLQKYDIPVVFFDRIPPLPNIHSVSCNIETGTVEAVNYLLKKGHRTIGMINGPKTLFASGERKEGYIKAMQKNRLKFDPTLVLNCDLTETGASGALNTLLNHKRKVTAIVTFNDYIALFIMKHLRALNLTGQEKPEIVSYANLPLIHYIEHVPVATVEQFPYLQGQRATEVLLDLLSRKDRNDQQPAAYYNIVIESQLIESGKTDQ